MSRILVVVPPLTGHVNPTVSLGAELGSRGHDVAWAGIPEVVEALLPAGARFLPVVGELTAESLTALRARGRGLRGAVALRFLWEDFLVPLARATAGALLTTVRQYEPDLLIVDQQTLAGAVVGRLTGVRWVTSATTSAELTDPLAALPKVDAWVRRQLYDLQVELGVPAAVAGSGDLRFSDHGTIAFTTRALAGEPRLPPGSGPVLFVGPSMQDRPHPDDFPFDRLPPDLPLVLVTLGTVSPESGARFFGMVVEALADQPVHAVLVAPPEVVRLPPAITNVLVQERIPQLQVLPRAAVVVTHGGHNTVCESLAHGIPLVVAPIRDDQPIVAAQVVAAGAGVRVSFGRARAAELRIAVDRALHDPSLRAGAQAVARSFEQAGGPSAAADHLDALLEVPV